MTEHDQEQDKDHFVWYVILAAVLAIGTLLAVKINENEKFSPIKQQLSEENRLMNIRVISQSGE